MFFKKKCCISLYGRLQFSLVRMFFLVGNSVKIAANYLFLSTKQTCDEENLFFEF